MASSQPSKTQEVNLIGMARVLTSLKWLPIIRGKLILQWSGEKKRNLGWGQGNTELSGKNSLKLRKRVFNNKPLMVKNFRDEAGDINEGCGRVGRQSRMGSH